MGSIENDELPQVGIKKREDNSLHSRLATALERAFMEQQVGSMSDLSDVTPHVNLSAWFRVFFYHCLNLFLLGPFAYFVVACFSGRQFAANMGFSPNKPMMMYFIMQIMAWMEFMMAVGVLAYEHFVLGGIKQELFIFIVFIANSTFRLFIIATRHSTTPPRIYRQSYFKPVG